MMDRTKELTFWDKLKDRYRLVVLNDDTLEEQVSYKLTRLNIYVLLSSLLVTLITLTILLIVITPLKEYIPGYGDTNTRKRLVEISSSSDSLRQVVLKQEAYINNIKGILGDSTGIHDPVEEVNHTNNPDRLNDTEQAEEELDEMSNDEMELRHQIEEEEDFMFDESKSKIYVTELKDFYFFPPIKGVVTSSYNAEKEHFGTDIVAPENEPIKSIADGTVIFSDWTLENGNVIAIQHEGSLVSFYKHNSVLLKKEGNFVKAGDAIAIIGNTGEKSHGTHLHFELWINEVPVNPMKYINFN